MGSSLSENVQTYSRPPITEAVVEFRCKTIINDGLLSKVNKRFAGTYPSGTTVPVPKFHVHVDNRTGAATSSVSNTNAYRRSAHDEHDILLINPNSLVVAQSAPYPGWDKFFERVRHDLRIWREAGVTLELGRIGMRYINRIDIPDTAPVINPADYLKMSLAAPEELGPTISYATNGNFALSDLQSNLQINSGVFLPPPVPGYLSLLLDFDIGRELEVPQSEDDIISLLISLRHEKNRIFELIVTDKARELFK